MLVSMDALVKLAHVKARGLSYKGIKLAVRYHTCA